MTLKPCSYVDDPFFGLRLKAARKMAGFSMDDLVQELGGAVTRQAISKYELGLMKPSSPILARLEVILGFGSINEEMSRYFKQGALEFRQQSRLPKKKEEALKRRAVLFFRRFAEIEELLGTPSLFRNPIPDEQVRMIRNREDVEKAAVEVRERWGLGQGPIVNLLGLLEAKGVKIYETSEAETGPEFDGLSAKTNGAPVMVINRDRPPDRIRFTAAHELGHVLCDIDIEGDGEKEKLCHSFAGAFLLPKRILARELVGKRHKITLWEIGAIKGTWGVSMQAIMYRAKELGLVTEGCFKEFQAAVKANGWTTSEPVEFKGREEAVRFRRLIHYAVAEGILDIEQGARLSGREPEEFENEIRGVF